MADTQKEPDLFIRIKRLHHRYCQRWETWEQPMIDTQGFKYIATITGCPDCGVEVHH